MKLNSLSYTMSTDCLRIENDLDRRKSFQGNSDNRLAVPHPEACK